METAVEVFYAKLTGDPRVAPFFAGIGMTRLKAKQVDTCECLNPDVPTRACWVGDLHCCTITDLHSAVKCFLPMHLSSCV